ncbi:MAG: c-type cytochrome [Cellvibrionaceae bacterium]|nr:c-type cytochrome [Cellvibrionaceae bacterium]
MEPNVNRGQELFANFCFLCHGQQGKGDGRMAKLLQTAPANLRKSQLDNKALAEIIRKGGAGVNRSEQMPAWGDQFTAIDVQSLVLFIKSLQEEPMDADKAKKRAAIK